MALGWATTAAPLISLSPKPLPSSFRASGKDCYTQVPIATEKLFQCLLSNPIMTDDETQLVSRCGCFHGFLQIGDSCKEKMQIKNGAVIRDMFSAEVDNRTLTLCEPYWQQWGMEGAGFNWWESPEGIMCEVLILILLLAVCFWCCWDVLKDTMEERQEMVSEVVHDVEDYLLKMEPSVKETLQAGAERCTTTAGLAVETFQHGVEYISPINTPKDEVDSSDDEENDRKAMGWKRFSPRQSWSIWGQHKEKDKL